MAEVLDTDYTQATLCFPIRGDEVLLAYKQKKIGAGLLNGFGGRAETKDRDIYDTNFREVEEEIGIRLKTVRKIGKIAFHNPSKDERLRRMMVHIFKATEWEGEPVETEEMKKINWYKINDIDYEKFLKADRKFMPDILNGKCLEGLIEYEEVDEEWVVKTCDLHEVDGFDD